MGRKLLLLSLLFLMGSALYSQTTEFTYQGSLKDGASAANASYDFEFRLFAADTGGTAIGSLQRLGVQVSNGSFNVKLDFGAQFPGAARYLEIAIKPAGGGTFTTLTPRQQISNTPYSVRSLNSANADIATNATNANNATTATNALQLGSIAANQFVLTTDPRMTDARSPTAGSNNYIHNGTTPQTSTFNVSGDGIVGGTVTAIGGLNTNNLDRSSAGSLSIGSSNATSVVITPSTTITNALTVGGTLNGTIVNAATQYNIGGSRILSIPLGSNVFVGPSTGLSNTNGNFNSFFGWEAGLSNTVGNTNAFFGARAGSDNINGTQNAFFGVNAGRSNISGSGNTFVGGGSSPFGTGYSNTDGNFNSFVGHRAGQINNGSSNSFFGTGAGLTNSLGNSNSFFGHDAGDTNGSGSFNVVIGDEADVGVGDLTNATAIGSNALVTTSNSLVLGSISGTNGATADTKVGIGITAPTERLHVVGNGVFAGNLSVTGNVNAATSFVNNITVNNQINAGTGIFGSVQTQGLTVPQGSSGGVSTPRLTVGGPISVGTISFVPASGGGLSLCLTNLQSQIATCSSSIRYKRNVSSFMSGLSVIDRLRPVSFNWKDSNIPDLGFVAEDVAKVEPLLVSHNSKGEVEGVKYDRVAVVAVNAIKEQQAELEKQREQINKLQREIDKLRAVVTSMRRTHRRSRNQSLRKK